MFEFPHVLECFSLAVAFGARARHPSAVGVLVTRFARLAQAGESLPAFLKCLRQGKCVAFLTLGFCMFSFKFVSKARVIVGKQVRDSGFRERPVACNIYITAMVLDVTIRAAPSLLLQQRSMEPAT